MENFSSHKGQSRSTNRSSVRRYTVLFRSSESGERQKSQPDAPSLRRSMGLPVRKRNCGAEKWVVVAIQAKRYRRRRDTLHHRRAKLAISSHRRVARRITSIVHPHHEDRLRTSLFDRKCDRQGKPAFSEPDTHTCRAMGFIPRSHIAPVS